MHVQLKWYVSNLWHRLQRQRAYEDRRNKDRARKQEEKRAVTQDKIRQHQEKEAKIIEMFQEMAKNKHQGII